jgi:hypothetical protein
MSPNLSRAAAVLAAVLMAGPAFAQGKLVKVDGATQKRLGLETAPLVAAERSATSHGFARVVDPVPLATLDSDISTAAAALAASQAEASRARALASADATVSRKVAEAAAAQARADAAKLSLLRRRVGLEWGPAFAQMSDARRGRLVADIAAGRASLVRIDSAAGTPQTRGSAAIDLGGGQIAHAAVLGPARTSDPRLQTTGLIGLVTGPMALRLGAGTVAPATLAVGAAAEGVIIPRVALLRTGGQTFAYVRRDGSTFERRAIEGGVTDPQGLFAPTGFQPGAAVVVKGAAQLFAAESTPAKED